MSSDQKSVSNVLKEEVNIIIGTQIIAKGHNFRKLTLVGVINAKTAVISSDQKSVSNVLKEEVNIIIGTQIIVKGHNLQINFV